jgi:hypothetical protein
MLNFHESIIASSWNENLQSGFGKRNRRFLCLSKNKFGPQYLTDYQKEWEWFPSGRIHWSSNTNQFLECLNYFGESSGCAAVIAVLDIIKQSTSEGALKYHLFQKIETFRRSNRLMLGMSLIFNCGITKDLILKHHMFTGNSKLNLLHLPPMI